MVPSSASGVIDRRGAGRWRRRASRLMCSKVIAPIFGMIDALVAGPSVPALVARPPGAELGALLVERGDQTLEIGMAGDSGQYRRGRWRASSAASGSQSVSRARWAGLAKTMDMMLCSSRGEPAVIAEDGGRRPVQGEQIPAPAGDIGGLALPCW